MATNKKRISSFTKGLVCGADGRSMEPRMTCAPGAMKVRGLVLLFIRYLFVSSFDTEGNKHVLLWSEQETVSQHFELLNYSVF